MSNVHGIGDAPSDPEANRPSSRSANPLRNAVNNVITAENSNPENESFPDMLKTIMCPYFKGYSFTTLSSLAMLAGFALQLALDHLTIPGTFLQVNSTGPITSRFEKNPTKIHDNNAYYQLLTAIFLSLDFMHISSNLISQLIFGSFIENLLGRWQLAAVFLISGVWGNLFSSAISHADVSVGASGAIFGELGAMVGYILLNWKKMDENTRCRLVFFVVFILLFNFMVFDPSAGSTGHGVDMLGHVGGMISGVFLGMGLLPSQQQGPTTDYEKRVKMAGWILFTLASIGVISAFFGLSWE